MVSQLSLADSKLTFSRLPSPSLTFAGLLSPPLTFPRLPSPSLTFAHLPSPSLAFSRLLPPSLAQVSKLSARIETLQLEVDINGITTRDNPLMSERLNLYQDGTVQPLTLEKSYATSPGTSSRKALLAALATASTMERRPDPGAPTTKRW